MHHTTLTRVNCHITDSLIIARLCSPTSETIAGEIIDLLASKPGCLQSFWSSIEPAFTSCHVRSAAKELRYAAAIEVKNKIHLPNHLDWLYENEYNREDTRQIRYIVEAFSNLEPVFAVLAALALKWLENSGTQPNIVHSECDCSGTDPAFIAPISLADGLHSQVHKFYKALSVWPCYARKVLDDSAGYIDTFEDSVAGLLRQLKKLADNIPMQLYDDIYIAYRDELKDSICRCMVESCEVILLSSSLRRMFIKAETDARLKRITCIAHRKIMTAGRA